MAWYDFLFKPSKIERMYASLSPKTSSGFGPNQTPGGVSSYVNDPKGAATGPFPYSQDATSRAIALKSPVSGTIGGGAYGPNPASNTPSAPNTPQPTVSFAQPKVTGTGGVYGASGGSASLAKSQADQQRQFLEDQQRMLMEQRTKQRDQTLGFIDQRRNLLGQEFSQNKDLAESGATANTQTAQAQAGLSLRQIDEALQAALPVLNRNKNNVIDESEKGYNRTADLLQRAFAARGAEDSSFYARAVAESQGEITKQRNDQLFAIDQAVSNATTQAEFQKAKVNTELNAMVSELTQKKQAYLVQLEQAYNQGRLGLDELAAQTNLELENFATEAEIAKLGQLQQIQFNLDNYLQGLSERAAAARSSISGAAGTGANYDVSKALSTFNSLYSGLSKAAKAENAGIAPRGATGTFAYQAGLLDQAEQPADQYAAWLNSLMNLNDEATIGF